MDLRKEPELRRLLLCMYFYEKGDSGRLVRTSELVEALVSAQRKANGGLLLPALPGARRQLSRDRADSAALALERSVSESLRKRVYGDIDVLIDAGMKIEKTGARSSAGYRWITESFDQSELDLLVDVVSSCSFLTSERARELVGKIQRISRAQYDKASEAVARVSTHYAHEDAKLFENFLVVQMALRLGKHIRFNYGHQRDANSFVFSQFRGRKKNYAAFPVDLYLSDGFYYVAATFAEVGSFSTYPTARDNELNKTFKVFRLDRMRNIKICPRKEALLGARTYYDQFLKTAERFGQGFLPRKKTDIQRVRFSIPDDKTHIVLDRFGDAITLRHKDGLARFSVRVELSDQFFGWVAGLSGLLRIEGPSDAVKAYKDFLQSELARYQTEL